MIINQIIRKAINLIQRIYLNYKEVGGVWLFTSFSLATLRNNDHLSFCSLAAIKAFSSILTN